MKKTLRQIADEFDSEPSNSRSRVILEFMETVAELLDAKHPDPEPVRYREAELRDVGREVQARDYHDQEWRTSTLVGVTPGGGSRFGCTYGSIPKGEDIFCWFCECRVPMKPHEEIGYREPVMPADAGKEAEFSHDGKQWTEGVLLGFKVMDKSDVRPWYVDFAGDTGYWEFARIKTEVST